MMTSKKLWQQPSFWIGLLLRIALIACLLPQTHTDFYGPFLFTSVYFGHVIDPWTFQNMNPLSFPYGIVAFWILAPAAFLFKNMSDPIFAAHFVIGFCILLFDGLILKLLTAFSPKDSKKILIYYWLCPLVLYLNYIQGQITVFPLFFLLLSFFYLTKNKGIPAGIALGICFATQWSLYFLYPIFFLFLYQSLKGQRLAFIVSHLITLSLLLLPYLFNPDYIHMVLKTPTTMMPSLFDFALITGTLIFIHIKQKNTSVFSSTMIAFILFFILNHAAIDWYLYLMAFVVLYQIQLENSWTANTIYIIGGLFAIFSSFYFTDVELIPIGANFVLTNTSFNGWQAWSLVVNIVLLYTLYRETPRCFYKE